MCRCFSASIRAFYGRCIWKKLKRLYAVGERSVLVVMPEDDPELNRVAFQHLNELIAWRNVEKAVVLAAYPSVLAVDGKAGGKVVVQAAKEQAINSLLAYYELCRFSEYVKVVSLTKPFGNMAYRAAGFAGVTLHELVCLCVFGMRNWADKQGSQMQDENV